MASTKTSIVERRAQAELIQAERRGEIRRPYFCSRCLSMPEHRMGIQAHHHVAYDQPLNVLWLCIACHQAEHQRLRAEERSIPLSTRVPGCADDAPYSP